MKNESRYSLEEIKRKFQHYRDDGDFKISDREYDIFCDVMRCLPKEDVDKVLNEVYFVVLSNEVCDGQPACYLLLESKGNFENKKAVIFLSPLVFDHQRGPILHWYNDILHEVAHYILGHIDFENEEDEKRIDDEANQQAEKWYLDCLGNRVK